MFFVVVFKKAHNRRTVKSANYIPATEKSEIRPKEVDSFRRLY